MTRYEALKIILENIKETDLAIFTTGMISREAFAVKDRLSNFYMVGSMGLVTPLALGVASNTSKKVVAIDGDGSMFLNLGAMTMVASEKPKNLISIVIDNGCYESTGAQPSISNKVDLEAIAKAAGYQKTASVSDLDSLNKKISELLVAEGPCLLLIKTDTTRQDGTPRVSYSPVEIKERFRQAITS